MKLVIQRVASARVKIAGSGEAVGEIGEGIFILVGVGKGDTKAEAENLAQKISKLRIMSDDKGKMNLSVKETGKEILVVSQFTLYADTNEGNRPSFIKAAEPKLAEEVYEHFVKSLKDMGLKVETGRFGAYMEIEAKLDGPVTILLT